MKFHDEAGLWLPDGEAHLLQLNKHTRRPVYRDYQHDRLEAAYPRVTDWGCAVDGGAHVGLMTRALARRFAKVYAFEPHPETFACLQKNTARFKNVVCVNAALAEAAADLYLEDGATANTGDRQIATHGAKVKAVPLDAVDLAGLGLLKLDVQGYETRVLAGAMNTLMAFAPVMVIEVEPRGKLRMTYAKDDAVNKTLERMEAAEFARVGADRLFAFGPDGACPYVKYRERGAYHWQQYRAGKLTGIVEGVADYVRRQRHRTLVDLGCGDGLFTSKCGATLGIDNNTHAVALARAHGVDAKHLSVYRARELGRRFDAAMLFDVFEHLHKPDLALRVAAALAPTLYLLNPDPNGSHWHSAEYTAESLTDFVRARGWRVVTRERYRVTSHNIKTFFHLERP